MPILKWSEVDFLDFFAVDPAAEEHAISHTFKVRRGGLRLLFQVWTYESAIQASLFRTASSDALFSIGAYVRGEARLIDDQRGRFIEFDDCIFAPDRFWYNQVGNPFDRDRFPNSMTMKLSLDPDIRIAFGNHESRT